ncbi:MAG: 26S proteasome subunit RPN7-domain-containing protein [Benjaminiella poitrasii]|nr:MAG: 26S proteasome subunit RPN7-domain-containing protein [Benjaminiella poitrasii]
MEEFRIDIPEGFDFESYINNYEGLTRITRSLFIARHCDALAMEAYRTAIQDIKELTLNTTKYCQTVDLFNDKLRRQGQATLPMDQEWMTNVQNKCKSTLDTLENELRISKSNVNKEEIRVCYSKLGDFYYKKGDSQAAMKNYIRTRDYCSTSENVLDMCFNAIKVYLDDSNFSHVVQTYISRAESTPNVAEKVNASSKLKCCQALTLLGSTGIDQVSRYKSIANALNEVSFEAVPQLMEIMSANDIAIYGGLTALASYDRRQLQTQVLNNTNFKSFLVTEPALHELIEAFCKAKYATCFQLLERYKQSLRIDVYLQPHLSQLIQLVRERAMVQYCIPYNVIDMRKMASAFNLELDALEDQLVMLIGNKEKISARIDSHNKILCTKKREKRKEAFDRSLVAGDDFEKSSKALLLRLNLLKANLVVK